MRNVLSLIVGLILVLVLLKTCVEGHSMARNDHQDATIADQAEQIASLRRQLIKANINTARGIAKLRAENPPAPAAPCDLQDFVFQPVGR